MTLRSEFSVSVSVSVFLQGSGYKNCDTDFHQEAHLGWNYLRYDDGWPVVLDGIDISSGAGSTLPVPRWLVLTISLSTFHTVQHPKPPNLIADFIIYQVYRCIYGHRRCLPWYSFVDRLAFSFRAILHIDSVQYMAFYSGLNYLDYEAF